MQHTRRTFMTTAGATLAAATVAPQAFAQWRPSERYPDPAVEILDPSFAKYRLALASVERLAHGHALVRRPGLVRRRSLPAVERHPQQPHHALGGGDRRASASSASRPTMPTATPATARAGSSPASTTRAASRAPSTTAPSPC